MSMRLTTSTYRAEAIREIPPSASIWYFPDGSKVAGKDGLLVSVSSEHGPEWVGMFATDRVSENGVSGLFDAGDGRMLVLSTGSGYIVDPADPSKWNRVGLDPIIGVHMSPDGSVIVLNDFGRLAAYGSKGRSWISRRISYDGFKDLSVSDTMVAGIAWDVVEQQDVPFSLSLADGILSGGPDPLPDQ